MRTFLKRALLFLILVILGYPIVIVGWAKFAPNVLSANAVFKSSPSGQMAVRLRELDSVKNIDVLFLGSSHAYRGFDVRKFKEIGFTSFNLGSSAQTPIQTNMLLNRYLKKLRPRFVIYEVYPQTFCSDGVESALDIMACSNFDYQLVQMSLTQNNIKVYNSLICNLVLNGIFHENAKYLNIKNGNDTYIQGGYISRNLEYNTQHTNSKQAWNFNELQLESFKVNIELIKDSGAKIFIVQAPYTKSLYNSFTNNSSFDEHIKPLGEYINYNTRLALSDSIHFYDKDHLNELGVQVFNTALIQDIFSKVN